MKVPAVLPAVFPAVLAAFGVLCARAALATDRACSPMAVAADAAVRRLWPGLPERIRESFDARDDIDACARVALAMNHGSIAVEVVLPDGRSASRLVARGDDVMSTLQALLLIPRDRAPERTSTSASEAPEPRQPHVARSGTPVVESRPNAAALETGEPSSSPETRASYLRIELSVLMGARIGGGQAGVGLGAISVLDIGGWLIGFQGRLDGYQPIATGEPAAALELALLGGRRLRFGTRSLDLVAGIAAALRGMSKVTTQAGSDAPPISESDSSTAPRLLFGARLNFNARSTVRTFVGLDGELAPTRAPRPELPMVESRLPPWTVGIALGATVGTR